MHHRQRDGVALLLPARQLVGPFERLILQPQPGQDVIGFAFLRLG
jgi:hypothetical protein